MKGRHAFFDLLERELTAAAEQHKRECEALATGLFHPTPEEIAKAKRRAAP